MKIFIFSQKIKKEDEKLQANGINNNNNNNNGKIAQFYEKNNGTTTEIQAVRQRVFVGSNN